MQLWLISILTITQITDITEINKNNMEIKEKINVRGAIKALEVGKSLELPKAEYIPSSVRSNVAIVSGDTGKKFRVSVVGNTIIVKRIK